MKVYVLFREGPMYDGGDTMIGVFASEPSRMQIAREYFLQYSALSCWRDGRPRRKPHGSRPRRIPWDDFYTECHEVQP